MWGRHDTEVAATAVQCPEQLGVLALGRCHRLPVGGHDLHGNQVVGGEPVRPGQPAHTSAQGQPGDTGAGHYADRHDQAVGLSGRIDVRQGSSALYPNGSRLRVDEHGGQPTQVQHHPALDSPGACDVVTTTADR